MTDFGNAVDLELLERMGLTVNGLLESGKLTLMEQEAVASLVTGSRNAVSLLLDQQNMISQMQTDRRLVTALAIAQGLLAGGKCSGVKSFTDTVVQYTGALLAALETEK